MSPDPTPHKSVEDINTILRMSQDILAAAQGKDVQNLNQLLLERGNLIKTLQNTDFDTLESSERETLTAQLDKINALEPEVQASIQTLRNQIGDSLISTYVDKKAIQLYRLSPAEPPSTRSEDG